MLITQNNCFINEVIWESTNQTISNACHLELSLSRTFSSVPSALSVTALLNSFGISNPAVSNYIELFSYSLQRFLFLSSISSVFISLIWMLKEYIRKLWSNVYLCVLQYKNMSVKRKLNVKSLSEKCQALKDLESLLMSLRKSLRMPLPRKR